MSALAEGRRQTASRRGAKAVAAGASRTRPYFVMNGATMVSIAAIAITVIGLLYLIQTSQVAQLGYDMSRLQTQQDTLSLEIAELQYEIARYESLQTIEQVAEERLGMTALTDYEFIEVQEPVDRELKLPDAERSRSTSIVDRIFNAVAGIGFAESKSSGVRYPATGGETP